MFKNKRGQIINMISATAIGIMVLIFTIIAVLYGISTLSPSTFFTANSLEANATSNLTVGLTTGVGSMGTQIPTVFKVLAIVLALGAIAILVMVVKRMKDGGDGSGGL